MDFLHNGGAYNHAVRILCHFLCLLLGGNAKTDGTGNLGVALHHFQKRRQVRGDFLSLSRNPKGGHDIQKSFRIFRNLCDTILGGGGYHGNEGNVEVLTILQKLFPLFIGHIRKNKAGNPCLLGLFHEFSTAVGENHIGIGHIHKGHIHFLPKLLGHLKNLLCGGSSLQSPKVGFHNHRSLCGGVGEGNAQLNQVRSIFHHALHHFLGTFQIRIPTGDERNKRLSLCKCLFYASHSTRSSPLKRATETQSLSPLPEIQMTMLSSLLFSFATFMP